MFRLFTGTEPKTCAYFDQLSDVYGYRPNVTPLATSSSSGAGDTDQDMKDDAASSDEETSSVLKKHTTASAMHATAQSINGKGTKRRRTRRQDTDVLEWMEEYKREKNKQEEEKLQALQQMHHEKVQMMAGLTDVLRSLINK